MAERESTAPAMEAYRCLAATLHGEERARALAPALERVAGAVASVRGYPLAPDREPALSPMTPDAPVEDGVRA